MASLPSKSFMFNYNAKQYDSSTYTFPKTQGQLFNEDITLNKAPSSYSTDSVYFGTSQAYTGRTGYTSSTNPFNRDSTNCTFTFIYKTSGWTSNDGRTRIFANRYPSSQYNFWIMGDRINNFILNTPTNYSPQICVIRVYSDNSATREFLDEQGNVVASSSATSIDWYNNYAQGFGFFHGYADVSDAREFFNQTFYWMYCSLETLSDAEIQQVINYNERLGLFDVQPTSLEFEYTGGSNTITVNYESGWTASTVNSWIHLSSISGSGDATITVTVDANDGLSRTGSITFTSDSQDEITASVTQKNHPIVVPYKNLYINGNRIN